MLNRFAGLAVLLIGLMSLFRYLGQPRIQILHGADIVGLTGCGACLGFRRRLRFPYACNGDGRTKRSLGSGLLECLLIRPNSMPMK